MDGIEVGFEDGKLMALAQDRVRWRALGPCVLHFRVWMGKVNSCQTGSRNEFVANLFETSFKEDFSSRRPSWNVVGVNKHDGALLPYFEKSIGTVLHSQHRSFL